jgi:hypothetical protein
LAHSVRADFYRRLGKIADARASYHQALALALQDPERRLRSVNASFAQYAHASCMHSCVGRAVNYTGGLFVRVPGQFPNPPRFLTTRYCSSSPATSGEESEKWMGHEAGAADDKAISAA